MRLESVLIGITTMRANPLRTALSTLGVIIGVASLVAILALGDGLEQFTRSQIEQTTDLQMISVSSVMVDRVDGVLVRRANPAIITPVTADSLAAELGERGAVALTISGSGWVRADRDTLRHAVLLTAGTTGSAAAMGFTVESGRMLTPADSSLEPVPVLVSPSFAAVLQSRHGFALGERLLQESGPALLVVGVLAGPASGPLRVYLPLDAATVRALGDAGRIGPDLLVKAARVEDVEGLARRVTTWLHARWDSAGRPFTVQTSVRRVAQARQGIIVFKLIMGSITGISLLVGGIGIMNILLASVAERTREIGIRKAVGARGADIRTQFLAESVAISGAGSLAGVLLGLGGAYLITGAIRRFSAAQIYAGFAWSTVLVAAIAAIAVGVIFGTYPARRAARLSPIDAIRHE